jgi:hypothetical protein
MVVVWNLGIMVDLPRASSDTRIWTAGPEVVDDTTVVKRIPLASGNNDLAHRAAAMVAPIMGPAANVEEELAPPHIRGRGREGRPVAVAFVVTPRRTP